MPSHSDAERHALANALTQAGPGAATLCAGWTTNDLAAHLVVRELRPDAIPGRMLPQRNPLHRWTTRVERNYANQDFDQLVHTFRTGPHRLSWASLPGMDARLNLLEHVVHCEDVRRAVAEWEPRDLPLVRQRAVWAAICQTGRMLLRRSPVPVTFTTVDGATSQIVAGTGGSSNARGTLPGVVVTGAPVELALYAFGRGEHTEVELDGPPDALTLFRAVRLTF